MPEADDQAMRDCADDYVKAHRKAIVAQNIEGFHSEVTPVSMFMAGSPGAGKTETSKLFLKDMGNPLRIDADELRDYFKNCGYNGTNSHLFQKSASKLVHEIHNAALKKRISFLLDGTFADERIARQNIERSLKRGRSIFIIFVYQSPQQAWRFVQMREKVEGRRIRPHDFAKKFCDSQAVVNKLKADFKDKVTLSLVHKNIDGSTKFYHKSIQRIDDHIPEKYGEAQILSVITDHPAHTA